MLAKPARSRLSIDMSIGTPLCSMAAAAVMYLPRNNARGRSIFGHITGSNLASAKTSLSQ